MTPAGEATIKSHLYRKRNMDLLTIFAGITAGASLASAGMLAYIIHVVSFDDVETYPDAMVPNAQTKGAGGGGHR